MENSKFLINFYIKKFFRKLLDDNKFCATNKSLCITDTNFYLSLRLIFIVKIKRDQQRIIKKINKILHFSAERFMQNFFFLEKRKIGGKYFFFFHNLCTSYIIFRFQFHVNFIWQFLNEHYCVCCACCGDMMKQNKQLTPG